MVISRAWDSRWLIIGYKKIHKEPLQQSILIVF